MDKKFILEVESKVDGHWEICAENDIAFVQRELRYFLSVGCNVKTTYNDIVYTNNESVEEIINDQNRR